MIGWSAAGDRRSAERRPSEPQRAAWRLLAASARGRRREAVELVFWSILEGLPAFFAGRLVARAIDDGFLDGKTGTGFAWLGLFGATVIVGAVATRQTFLRLAAIVEPFRDHLAQLAVTAALRRSTTAGTAGDTAGVARLTRQVEIVREAFASVVMVTQRFVVVTAGAVVGMATLMPEVVLFVVPPLVLGLGLFFTALGGMAARQRDSILAEERIAEEGSAVAGGLRDVVASGGQDAAAAMVGEHVDAQARATRELARFTAIRTISVAVGGLVPILLILLAGSWLVNRGATAGMILGALVYVSQGVQPALRTLINGLGGPGLWLMVTLRRIVTAAETAPSEASGPAGEAVPDGRVGAGAPATMAGTGANGRASGRAERGHAVHLAGVTFAYGPHAQPVIRDLDLIVPDGDHLAVVGPSGAGKSTLANLMCGVLQPQAGEVRLGGVPLEHLGPAARAERRALIPQEAYVFAGTLRENLAYLRPAAPIADIDDAVNELGLQPLAERLGGYDAPVDLATLSGGERQLITLVRAFLSPAPLVVLDEASCHLDPAAEARVEQAFARRPGALIVIAHRISSALRARRVLVQDGAEAQLATHDELLERSALYRDLVGRWTPGSADLHGDGIAGRRDVARRVPGLDRV